MTISFGKPRMVTGSSLPEREVTLTEPSERGKLLGMCQVGHEKVDADAVLRAIGTPLRERSLGPDGRYIWRWALPITKAVYFDPQPDLRDVL